MKYLDIIKRIDKCLQSNGYQQISVLCKVSLSLTRINIAPQRLLNMLEFPQDSVIR